MLIVKTGDIFDSECEALVNPVNTVGVMGKGLALQFKQRFPVMFEEYKSQCKAKILTIGTLHCWSNPTGGWIINFPTKEHYRNPSKIEYIDKGLVALLTLIKELSLKSIAIPAIGCGLGGLSFDVVLIRLKLLHDKLNNVEMQIFEP